MNRGHALMERTRVDAFDGTGEGEGHRMSTLAFWNVDGQGVWTVGEGNSWTESIRLFSGGPHSGGPQGALEFDLPTEDGSVDAKIRLVVHDSLRPGGPDRGETYQPTWTIEFQRKGTGPSES